MDDVTDYVGLKFWNGSAWVPVGVPGPAGASAYQIAVDNGYLGTEEEFAASLDTSNIPAANVQINTTGFNNNLDPSIDTVQELAVAVDDLQTASQLIVQNEGTSLAVRPKINFVGGAVAATDDIPNDRTNVTIAVGTRSTPGIHAPKMAGARSDFGVPGRAYYLPFVAPALSFTAAQFNLVVLDAGGSVEIAIYEYTGGFTINKVKDFGVKNTWPGGAIPYSIIAPTPWVPTPETKYFIGVLTQGTTIKLMSADLIPFDQYVGTAGIWPPGAGYQSSATNLTSLPATDLAPALGSYTETAPIIQLTSA